MSGPRPPARSARTRVALAAVRVVNAASRRIQVGSGTVVGGRAGLALDPGLLTTLTLGRPVALVSGTNGKTTTTRLLAVALEAGRPGSVVTNATGSNMPAGHVAALAAGPDRGPAVLEVDEGYLPLLIERSVPEVVVLLNLSRDQLDRTSEVRMLAGRWRAALADARPVVVANADDPLVVWGAELAPRVVWVAAGMRWRADAVGCPACEGRITFTEGAAGGPDATTWSCTCGFSRPEPSVWPAWAGTDGEGPVAAHWADGGRHDVTLALPGRFNVANAVMAAAAAAPFGVAPAAAFEAMATVTDVAGRFTTKEVGGVATRLLLAKNPAGWGELLELVGPSGAPVVVGINARVADGRDPSWLWDVPFERLAGRPVVATGDRWADLSVRLHYAGVAHQSVPDPVAAVGTAAGGAGTAEGVDFIGNYTAFRDLLER